MKTETWQKTAAIGVSAVSALILGYVAARYLAGILFPFAAAALIAFMLRPAARRLHERTRMPEKLAGTLLILACVAVLSVGIVLALRALYDSASDLAAALLAASADEGAPLSRLLDGFGGETARRIGEWESAAQLVQQFLRRAASGAAQTITELAAGGLMHLPGALLAVAVAVIALFYLLPGGESLAALVKERIGESAWEKAARAVRAVCDTVSACLRAYCLLLLLTFAELLAGFLLLDLDNPARSAWMIALVDLLPVFGVGTVLIPWGLVRLLCGDVFRGVGLLVVYGVVAAVRQFAEPRILGTSLGVHPFFALIAVYAGLRLFGVAGILLAPLALVGVKALLRSFSP